VTLAGTTGLPDPTEAPRRAWGGDGHVIVCGLRGVGLRTVEQLHQSGVAVVVVGLGSVGIRVVEGLVAEGRSVVVIERDGRNRYLDRARALRVPVVLRVFDRDLARMMERNFGFRHVRSTSALAAPWFVGAALGLDVLGTFFVDQQPFLVGRLAIASGGGLQGLAMQDLSARTRVVALRRAAWRSSARPAGEPASRAATSPTCSAPTTSCSTCCGGTSGPAAPEAAATRPRRAAGTLWGTRTGGRPWNCPKTSSTTCANGCAAPAAR